MATEDFRPKSGSGASGGPPNKASPPATGGPGAKDRAMAAGEQTPTRAPGAVGSTGETRTSAMADTGPALGTTHRPGIPQQPPGSGASPGAGARHAERPGAPGSSSGSDAGTMASNLRDTAGQVASDAQRRAADEGSDLRETAGRVAEHAQRSASELAGQVTDAAADVAHTQQRAGADMLRSISRAAGAAASELDRDSPAVAGYVREVADTLDSAARNLRDQDLGQMARTVTDFARSQPAVFVAGTVLAGFVLARFLKSEAPAESRTGSGMSSGRMVGQGSGTGMSGAMSGRDDGTGVSGRPAGEAGMSGSRPSGMAGSGMPASSGERTGIGGRTAVTSGAYEREETDSDRASGRERAPRPMSGSNSGPVPGPMGGGHVR